MQSATAYWVPAFPRVIVYGILLNMPMVIMIALRRYPPNRFFWASGYLWALVFIRERAHYVWSSENWSGAVLGLASLPGIYVVINCIAGVKD